MLFIAVTAFAEIENGVKLVAFAWNVVHLLVFFMHKVGLPELSYLIDNESKIKSIPVWFSVNVVVNKF